MKVPKPVAILLMFSLFANGFFTLHIAAVPLNVGGVISGVLSVVTAIAISFWVGDEYQETK